MIHQQDLDGVQLLEEGVVLIVVLLAVVVGLSVAVVKVSSHPGLQVGQIFGAHRGASDRPNVVEEDLVFVINPLVERLN